MKKISFVLLLLVLLTSCASRRWCERHYPAPTVTITHDSVSYREQIIYRDSVVEFHIPGDTVRDSIKVIMPLPASKPFTAKKISKETTYASAQAWVENGVLYLDLIQKETAVQALIKSATKETTYWKEKYYTEVKQVSAGNDQKPQKKGMFAWGMIAGAILTIILLVALAYVRKWLLN